MNKNYIKSCKTLTHCMYGGPNDQNEFIHTRFYIKFLEKRKLSQIFNSLDSRLVLLKQIDL